MALCLNISHAQRAGPDLRKKQQHTPTAPCAKGAVLQFRQEPVRFQNRIRRFR
jgi:hypothetical protein